MMGIPRENFFGYLPGSWSEEQKITGLVTALTFHTVIGYPIVNVIGSSVAIQLANNFVLLAILILGLYSFTKHNITRMVLGTIILIGISVRSARFIFGAHWLLGWDTLPLLVASIAFVSTTMRYAYKKGRVTSERIQAAVAAYLLIVLAFSLSYRLISFFIPGAFGFADMAPTIDDPRFDYVLHYFSITTITTLGYGDIVPVHPFARSIATVEALVGQLYPGILLARLVSLSVVDREKTHK